MSFNEKNKKYLILLCLIHIILINKCMSFSTQKSDSMMLSRNKISTNPLFDLLTGLLHHAQYTKTCGSNIQRSSINFESLWNLKFQFQIRKGLLLASTLNHLLQDCKYEIAKCLQTIDQKLLISLNYFIFSNNNPYLLFQENRFARVVNETQFLNEHITETIRRFLELKNRAYTPIGKDKFIIAYGTVFYDNITDICTNKQCIYNSDSKSFFEPIHVNDSCIDNGDNSYVEIQRKKKDMTKSNNFLNNIKLQDENSENKPFECNTWYKYLYQSYLKIIQRVPVNVFEPKGKKYEEILQILTQNEEFIKHQWYGPYFECLNNHFPYHRNNWILIYSLPLFDRDRNFKGALMLKLNLTSLDINQCNDNDNEDFIFKNTHKCKINSECVFKPNAGFKLGGNILLIREYGAINLHAENLTKKQKNSKISDK